jgi:hypothetical protein
LLPYTRHRTDATPRQGSTLLIFSNVSGVLVNEETRCSHYAVFVSSAIHPIPVAMNVFSKGRVLKGEDWCAEFHGDRIVDRHMERLGGGERLHQQFMSALATTRPDHSLDLALRAYGSTLSHSSHTHTHTHARTHARARARAHTHTHTHQLMDG